MSPTEDTSKTEKQKNNGADYGWGCLIILIVIGIIAFAYFKPHDYVKHYILPGKTYQVNERCEHTPQLTLNTFEKTRKKTILSFTWTNQSETPDTFTLYHPGHKLSFYIFDIDEGYKYPLTKIINAHYLPHLNIVPPHSSLTFQLEFVKTESTNRFNLIEDETDNPAPRKFMDIELTNW